MGDATILCWRSLHISPRLDAELTKPPYIYRAKLINVVDGDTVDLAVDVGFRVSITDRFRLLGINAPEMHGTSSPAGKEAKAALASMLAGVETLTIKTHKGQDKYGRWLADIYVNTDGGELLVNKIMVVEGHAVEYFGGAR